MGSLNSVITLFKDVTKQLDGASFGYGYPDDFNSLPNKKFQYNWVDPIRGGFSNQDGNVGNNIEWRISINFLNYDDIQGNEKQTAIVMDKQFDRMEKWLHKLDREFLNDDANLRIQSGSVEIKTPLFEPIRKGFSDLVSGWNLNFILITQSDFDYCSIYE